MLNNSKNINLRFKILISKINIYFVISSKGTVEVNLLKLTSHNSYKL